MMTATGPGRSARRTRRHPTPRCACAGSCGCGATVRRIAAAQVQQLRLVAAAGRRLRRGGPRRAGRGGAGVGRPVGGGADPLHGHPRAAGDARDRQARRRSGWWSWPPAWSPSCPTRWPRWRRAGSTCPAPRSSSEETALLDDAGARAVQALVLAKVADADGPWQALSPRRWKSQIQRAVIQVDADAARRRREEAIRDRAVRAWPQGDGTGVLQIIGQDCDIAFADAVITNLALAGPATGPDGEKLSMDQRRVDGFMDLMRRVAFGDQLPQVPAPPRPGGRHRGARRHPLRRRARQERPRRAARPRRTRPHRPALRGGAGPQRDRRRAPPPASCWSTGDGILQRTLRLPEGAAGWLDPRPADRPGPQRPCRTCRPLQTESYEPTVAITDHVRAVHPRCTSYDCARLASRCDLDHDESWPRGPTCVTNLCPRCRRHHELKTRGLVRTRLHPDGSVTTTTLLGTTVTTRPEPVPGFGARRGLRAFPVKGLPEQWGVWRRECSGRLGLASAAWIFRIPRTGRPTSSCATAARHICARSGPTTPSGCERSTPGCPTRRSTSASSPCYRELSDRDVERFTEVDHVDRVALVATVGDEIIGVVRYDRVGPTRPRSRSTSRTPTRAAGSGRSSSSTSPRRRASAASGGSSPTCCPSNRKMLQGLPGRRLRRGPRDGRRRRRDWSSASSRPRNSSAVTFAREHRAEARSVERLLRPRRSPSSVRAARPRSVGRIVLQHIVDGGFTGSVYAVNPHADEVDGVPPYATVADVPGDGRPGRRRRPGRAGRRPSSPTARPRACAASWWCRPGSPRPARRARAPAATGRSSARADGMRVVGPELVRLAQHRPGGAR